MALWDEPLRQLRKISLTKSIMFCQPSQRILSVLEKIPVRFEGARDTSVVELVDASDSKFSSTRSAGSIRPRGNKIE